jgi:Zn finger protein HypA/HybF involved in hydrogenase expression
MAFADYRGLSKEDLRKLPPDELVGALYDVVKECEKLYRQLNQDSTNSSKAPSADSPKAKAKRKTEQESSQSGTQQKKQKQGAQPGHKAVSRPLVPLEEVERILDYKPDICEHCGQSLEGFSDLDPYRVQHYDFEIIRHITEYRKHAVVCPHCRKATEGTLPAEALGSVYGLNVVTLAGVLTGLFQMSRRAAAMYFNEVVRIPISVGSLSNLEKEMTEAALPVMEEIETVAQSAVQGNVDETGFGLEKGKQGWLWVLVTPLAVLFRLYVGRGQKWASKLLGEFDGILTSDRWTGYNHYPAEKRQLCWAHLIRDFRAMCEAGPDGEAVGKGLGEAAKRMFRMWHRFRKWEANQESAGVKISMTVLESQMTAVRKRIKALLIEGALRGVPKCASILKAEPLLWIFTREKRIEPTNNAAERAIRPAVLWKKRSFGVESARGARYVESMLSIWMTCRRNGVNPVKFLSELMCNSRLNVPAPSIFAPSILPPHE